MSSSVCNNQLSDATDIGSAVAERPAEAAKSSTYTQVLKSSALVGGSSALNIAIGIVRAKTMALLLGPAGVGLFGLFGSIADLTQSVAGMGISNSGVRQIAESAVTEDTDRIARTTTALRRTSLILAALGAAFLILFSKQASALTFGTPQRAAAVSLLSLAVFLRVVSFGQGALIQGMRRISDLAKMSVIGSLFGTIITIPLIYFLRENGVVPSLVAVAAMTILTSWWYSRKLGIKSLPLTVPQMGKEAGALLKLGFAFMASGLMMMGSAYAVRIIVLRTIGYEATGMYQAAWTIGGLYVGFILQAMGADFYPRLTAAANNNPECNRMVNEQARVGMLLAGPGVMATLTFAPLVIGLFYSAKFGPAVGILRWICLGVTLRVITWPIGFIVVAKGKQNLFFWTELAWTTMNVGFTWIFVRSFGLNGAGIAFFGAYVFHGFLIYAIVSRLSGFRWSPENRRTGLLFFALIATVFGSFYVLPFYAAICVGTLIVLVGGIYSLRVLLTLVSADIIPRPIRQLLAGFNLVPACSTEVS